MRILCEYPVGGEIFRMTGFGNALTLMGHEFIFWQSDRFPAHDVFYEANPDLFISTTFGLTDAVIDCIAKRPNMKVVLKGSNYGETDSLIPPEFPVVIASKTEVSRIDNLLQKTGRPNYIFCHYHENDLERTMGYWKKIGAKIVALPNAADVVEYRIGTYRKELASDVAFVGGYWGYKAINLDKTIVPLCSKIGQYNIKVWGNQPWFVPQYLGMPTNRLIKDIYASSKVCPNVSEPHSTEFGFDVVERPFKIISSGGFCMMDRISGAKHFFDEDEIGWYDTFGDFESSLKKYLHDEELRNEIKQKSYAKVMSQHTYHHRAEKMLEELN